MSLGPLLSVLLFCAAVAAAMLYLRMQEVAAVRQSLRHDGEYAHQSLSTRLGKQREALSQAAQQLALAPATAHAQQTLQQAAKHAGTGLPELVKLLWLDEAGRIIASDPATPQAANAPEQGQAAQLSAAERELLARARHSNGPVYGLIQPTAGTSADTILGLMLPVRFAHGAAKGTLYARYNLPSVLYHGMPADIYPRYAVALIPATRRAGAPSAHDQDAHDQADMQVSDWWQATGSPAYTYTVPLPAQELALRLQIPHTRTGMHKHLLLLVLALSALTGWMLFANWRHLRRRLQAQQVLQAETSFRRAMENSVQTGMRALDLQGRITYVNASFCHMTGLSEAELVGQIPPFSFWPPEEIARNTDILQQTFNNAALRGGYEVRVRHKDGHVFDARMYLSPLIGADGKHKGWMSAMTDITEPKRIRRELLAAQERFARVLDAIDTAVSVAPLGARELLFANRFYRQWFGEDNAHAHMHMLEQAACQPQESPLPPGALPVGGGGNAEIYLEHTQRWVEVRSRYLEWTDGRLAQLVVATDITARRLAEARSTEHEQRAQAASRLATMGEMASSVAHELNQPLTAIQNYCSGMRDRVANGTMQQQDLLRALEKTANQAQRAGQIIQRIREFVKRSAPNYMWADVRQIVEDAVELAQIEMRRRQVRLSYTAAEDVREVMADRILIEQVLVNLMKNAAEAIDNARMPVERREVRLSVSATQAEGKDAVRFEVCDRGNGLSADVLEHLFEAFYTTKAEGLGIGLNLCRSIVESHQGRLHAENLYNADKPQEIQEVTGCCFSFWLPVQPLVVDA